LFLWNLLSNSRNRGDKRAHTWVSILVFVELALELRSGESSKNVPGRSVSILVFVELALEHESIGAVSAGSKVSILVFVELALEPFVTLLTESRTSCFNPCFRGTCSRTFGDPKTFEIFELSFNPCFRGTCSRTVRMPLEKMLSQGVSILVFVELALERCGCHWKRCYPKGFQSLFSWNLLSNS